MDHFFQQAETWVAIAFVLFIILIIRLGWKRIVSLLDGRAKQIEQELDEARNLREEAQSLLADYQRKKRDAEKESLEIISFAKKEAEDLIKETKVKLAENLERRSNIVNEKIERAYAKAIQNAQESAAEIAISSAKNIIKINIDESKSQEITNNSITEIEKLI